MGLFDEIVSTIGKKVLGADDQQAGLLEQAMNLINNPAVGGLNGLIEKFQTQGLSDIISSWVGTGENQPISGEQIINTLGTDTIREIAGKLGVSDTQVSEGLSGLLPQIIDKLTPQGDVPEGSVLEQGIRLLSRQFLNR